MSLNLGQVESVIRSAVQKTFDDLDKVATGRTLDSVEIRSVVTGNEADFEITLGGGAPFIQSGRAPGAAMPPVQPISEWISARRLPLNPYAVAKSIAKNGIAPVDLLAALEENLLERGIAAQLEDSLADTLLNTVTNFSTTNADNLF